VTRGAVLRFNKGSRRHLQRGSFVISDSDREPSEEDERDDDDDDWDWEADALGCDRIQCGWNSCPIFQYDPMEGIAEGDNDDEDDE